MFTWTLDNASYNAVFVEALHSLLPAPLDAQELQLGCFAHIINISSTKVIKAVEDHFVAGGTANSALWPEEGDSDNEDPTVAARNPVSRCCTLVTAIRASGKQRAKFADIITTGTKYNEWKLEPLELLRDVLTRWDSTFLMIQRVVQLRKVCYHCSFPIIANYDSQLKNLSITRATVSSNTKFKNQSGGFLSIFLLFSLFVHVVMPPDINLTYFVHS